MSRRRDTTKFVKVPSGWARWEPWTALPPTARALYVDALLVSNIGNEDGVPLDGRLSARDVHTLAFGWDRADFDDAFAALITGGFAERDDGGGIFLPMWERHHNGSAFVLDRRERASRGGTTTQERARSEAQSTTLVEQGASTTLVEPESREQRAESTEGTTSPQTPLSPRRR